MKKSSSVFGNDANAWNLRTEKAQSYLSFDGWAHQNSKTERILICATVSIF